MQQRVGNVRWGIAALLAVSIIGYECMKIYEYKGVYTLVHTFLKKDYVVLLTGRMDP